MTPAELAIEYQLIREKACQKMKEDLRKHCGEAAFQSLDGLAKIHIDRIVSEARRYGQSDESIDLLLRYIAVKLAAKDY